MRGERGSIQRPDWTLHRPHHKLSAAAGSDAVDGPSREGHQSANIILDSIRELAPLKAGQILAEFVHVSDAQDD